MSVAQEIEGKLRESFTPQRLEVFDESDQHIGHAGYQEGGESHFRVVIRSEAFAPMSRIARHRAVHGALGAELVGRIHALSLDIAS